MNLVSNIFKFHKSISNLLILLLLQISVTACIGTVEDTDPDVTKSAEIPSSVIGFYGVTNAIAVASDAVEVYFIPISGNANENVVYSIRYDGLLTPISIPAGLLSAPDYKGEVYVQVQGLDFTRSYTFTVQARDIVENISSSSFVTATAQPFQTSTAIFRGIQTLKNTTGPAGKFSLAAAWVAAESSGAIPSMAADGDPLYYEVTLLETAKLGPADFDNASYGVDDGRIQYFYTPGEYAVTLPGLKAGTEYHVMVRCHNKLYVENSSNPYFKHEENHSYLTLSTYSDQASEITIEPDSVRMLTPDGNDGKNAIDMTWDTIIGTIDHVRVYYFDISSSFTVIEDDCELGAGVIKCQKLRYDAISHTIRDLQTGGEYSALVVACLDFTCAENKRFNLKSRKVVADLANFAGIQEIQGPRGVSDITSIYLIVTPADLSTGAIDGILVRYYLNTPDIIVPLNSPDPTDINSTDFIVDDIENPSSTFSIRIDNMNPSSEEKHCFSALPFLYDDGGNITYNTLNETFVCLTPNAFGAEPEDRMITAPSSISFAGMQSTSYTASSKSITALWSAPTVGVYDKYILVWREKVMGSPTFDYVNAIYGFDPNYNIVYLAPYSNSYAIYLSDAQMPGVGEVRSYEFGLLTLYQFYSNYYAVPPNSLDGYSAVTPSNVQEVEYVAP